MKAVLLLASVCAVVNIALSVLVPASIFQAEPSALNPEGNGPSLEGLLLRVCATSAALIIASLLLARREARRSGNSQIEIPATATAEK